MTHNQCGLTPKTLEVVVLSYNRFESLKLQVDTLSELGYINNPRIRVVIQDNSSSDGTGVGLTDFERMGVNVRRSVNNIGYGGSYIKAHQLCEGDYLWVIGDDLPAMSAADLLRVVDDFPCDMVYAAFKGSPKGMPLVSSKCFEGSAYVDLSVNDLVFTDSNIISLFGGFVSGLIWSRSNIQNTVNRYVNILLNSAFTSNSPQALLVLLFRLDNGSSYGAHDYFVRVFKRSILSGVAKTTTHSSSSRKGLLRGVTVLGVRRFMMDYGYGLFVPAVIWVRMTYLMGALYSEPGVVRKICDSHLDPMAFHFSVLYKLSNARSALVLFVVSLNRLLLLNYSSYEYSRRDCLLLIYRLIRCQLRGLKINKLYSPEVTDRN